MIEQSNLYNYWDNYAYKMLGSIVSSSYEREGLLTTVYMEELEVIWSCFLAPSGAFTLDSPYRPPPKENNPGDERAPWTPPTVFLKKEKQESFPHLFSSWRTSQVWSLCLPLALYWDSCCGGEEFDRQSVCSQSYCPFEVWFSLLTLEKGNEFAGGWCGESRSPEEATWERC